MKPQGINLPSVPNARELGGYVTVDGRIVKSGKLLRTGKLDKLTETDAHLLVNKYSLHHIIDFRDKAESINAPDIIPDTVAYHLVPVLENVMNSPTAKAMLDSMPKGESGDSSMGAMLRASGGPEQMKQFMAKGVYRGIAQSSESAAAYRNFFDIALTIDEHEGAILFHCTAGKDRTGIAAALLLTALGCDRQTIVSDYLLSNKYIVVDKLPSDLEIDPDSYRSLMGVDITYLETFCRDVEDSYGSVTGYLNAAIGLRDSEIARLRMVYTDTCYL